MSLKVPALLCLLPLLGCARGEHYGTQGDSHAFTGADESASASDASESDTSETDESASASQSGSQSGTSDPTLTSDATTDPTWSTSDPWTSDGTTWDTSDGVTWGTSDSSGELTSTTDPGCEPCTTPPGPCHEALGECFAGVCVYMPKDPGVACDDGDGCTTDDVCDGNGTCGGDALDCTRPHAKGGACMAGACQGWSCESPYENCDGKWDNGCEVPTKIANQCDANGLNPDGGCWTAYCGSSNDSSAKNFDNFYCVDCATCHVNGNQVQWCNHSTGNWYPPDAGSCGGYLDNVCKL